LNAVSDRSALQTLNRFCINVPECYMNVQWAFSTVWWALSTYFVTFLKPEKLENCHEKFIKGRESWTETFIVYKMNRLEVFQNHVHVHASKSKYLKLLVFMPWHKTQKKNSPFKSCTFLISLILQGNIEKSYSFL
jgi:hypothetical protein